MEMSNSDSEAFDVFFELFDAFKAMKAKYGADFINQLEISHRNGVFITEWDGGA
jgi:hypothetical protein